MWGFLIVTDKPSCTTTIKLEKGYELLLLIFKNLIGRSSFLL